MAQDLLDPSELLLLFLVLLNIQRKPHEGFSRNLVK